MGRKLALVQSKQKYPQPEKEAGIWFHTRLEPRSYGQEFYLNTLRESDITLCAGPAGCGKTWLAARYALECLATNRVSKIIVTKPIIEAGSEHIGFLPGTIEEKVGPYFASVADALEDHLGPTMLKKLLDSEKIKFVPIAYMRGRDFKHAFVLADECQNLTRVGIKTLLTRISDGSLMALNGDPEQIDLPKPGDSGFAHAISALRGRDSRLGVAELSMEDVQRHPLVSVVLKAL